MTILKLNGGRSPYRLKDDESLRQEDHWVHIRVLEQHEGWDQPSYVIKRSFPATQVAEIVWVS